MSDQEPVGRRSGKIFTAIMLLVFLVVLPVGSYIYLKKGYDYQKAAMQDLRKEHRMTMPADLALRDGTSEVVAGEDYHLIGLLPQGAEMTTYAEVLKRLHEQFDQPENLMIWSVFEGGTPASVQAFQETAKLPKDTSQLLFWTAESADFSTFVEDLQLKPEEKNYLPEGLIVLVDDSLYVRRAYPFTEEEALKQLVERTAILLPERSKPKPELRHKAEL